ncbi:MAG: AAA family ATPase [Candidatus Omnitrophica bacterium]|nr:AAA family ATPase [Candidatus Omnitrophota bacterium]
MYEKYWKLKEKPFENTPDPRFFYYSTQHEEALTRLTYAIQERKGAALLTGVFGCGKTLLAQSLLDGLQRGSYRIALIANPQLEYSEFLRAIASRLGATGLPTKKTEILTDYLLDVLNEMLENNFSDGKDTVVIIDEAHVIEDKKIFEELRMLLNFQHKDRFLLTLLLLGQPELRKNVDNIKQLAQRIAIRYHLDKLSRQDSEGYILHRLKIAGKEAPIFTKEAQDLIFEQSGGIPRRINHICDMSLLIGFGNKEDKIGKDIIREVVSDLEGRP